MTVYSSLHNISFFFIHHNWVMYLFHWNFSRICVYSALNPGSYCKHGCMRPLLTLDSWKYSSPECNSNILEKDHFYMMKMGCYSLLESICYNSDDLEIIGSHFLTTALYNNNYYCHRLLNVIDCWMAPCHWLERPMVVLVVLAIGSSKIVVQCQINLHDLHFDSIVVLEW